MGLIFVKHIIFGVKSLDSIHYVLRMYKKKMIGKMYYEITNFRLYI